MLRIGLTGGIGSGKTFAGKVFAALEVPVYEADIEARRLMETDKRIIDSVKELFGEEAYIGSKLNRDFISKIVFKDDELLARLNSIVHPVVHNDFDKWSLNYLAKPYVIEEAAILFESGGAEKMDYTIFVKSDLKTRIDRIMVRDGLSEERVQSRISNQLNDSEKENMADFIIFNDNGSMILPQIVDLHNKFLELNK